MIERKSKLTLIIISFLFLSLSVFAYEPDYKLEINKDEWIIGGRLFDNDNLESRDIYLVSRFPELIIQNLQDCKEHKIGVLDRYILSRQWIENKIEQSEKSINNYFDSLDMLFFDNPGTAQRIEKKDELEERLADERENLAFLNDLAIERVKLSSSFPISWKEYRDEQSLYEADFSGEEISQKGLDYLIAGRISNFGGRLLYQLELIYPDGRSKKIWERPGSDRDLLDFAGEASDALRDYILGRSWSVLEIKSENSMAGIYLDEELQGIGSIKKKTVYPGKHILEIVEEGYQPFIKEITFRPWESEIIEVSLEIQERESIRIITDPGEADVYIGAEWQGKSPLILSRPEEVIPLQIKKEGYKLVRQSLGPTDPARIKITMSKSEGDIKEELDNQKDRFYSSLGWFSLSVGVPLILYGINENYRNLYLEYVSAYKETHKTEYFYKAQDAYDVYYDTYYATWGTGILSGGLLVNSLFKLFKYIKLAEESADS